MEKEKTCCKITRVIEFISKKWILLILKTMLEGSATFCEIQKKAGDINSSTLSDRLDDLQEAGWIKREIISEKPVQIRYYPTDKGLAFGEELKSLERWVNKWETN